MRQSTLAKAVMSKGLMTCTQDTSVAEAAPMMVDHKLGSLVIVEGQRVVGLIMQSDLLKVIANQASAGHPARHSQAHSRVPGHGRVSGANLAATAAVRR